MNRTDDLVAQVHALSASIARQAGKLAAAQHRIGLPEDRNEIGRLQHAYGVFLDNRMFRKVADLFADEGP